MTSVTLRQGRFRGVRKDGIASFRNIPYAQPFRTRFQLPQTVLASSEEYSAEAFGASAPQPEQRLAFVTGPSPVPPKQDEVHCGVLSVYTPSLEEGKQLPVLVWIHGGACVVGSSQWPQYDGSNIARDGDVVCVCINHRLGALGFLYDENRSLDHGPDLPAGTADVVLAFEWVRDNIRAFGGDPDNVTAMGQSAGGYHVQSLLHLRPELIHRAIVQSSATSWINPPEQCEKVREIFVKNLPEGVTIHSASTADILKAQKQTLAAIGSSNLVPFLPTTSSVIGIKDSSLKRKQILVGWNATDGLAFAKLSSPGVPVSELDSSWSDRIFIEPSKEYIRELRELGHEVTGFELTWAPVEYELGPTHNTDLPLLFGADQWPGAACVDSGDLDEWLQRGKRWRKAIVDFARDGTRLQSEDGVKVFLE